MSIMKKEEQFSEIIFEMMTPAVLDQVMEIEQHSFSCPWSKESMFNEITRNHCAVYLVGCWNGRVVSYGGMWMVLDEAHITNIAVHPSYRGHGIGERMVRRMIFEADSRGATRMTLEVRRSNVVAQHLYGKCGFTATGFRPGYYTDNHEDALIMWRDHAKDDLRDG